MVWRVPRLGETWLTISPARTSSATPRVSPRCLNDKAVTTLAVVRNGSLTRVGSVASVAATTRSIAIQGDLIHRAPRIRQWVAKIFFRALSGEMLRVRHLHHVARPVEGPSAHRLREMRDRVVRGLRRSRRGQDFTRVAGSISSTTSRAPQLIATYTQAETCE